MILIKSIFAGILLGMPVGPLGALALKRMILNHPLHGIFFGIGFALVDAIYSILIGFGIHFFVEFIEKARTWLFLVGIFFFFFLAIHIFLEKVKEEDLNKPEDKKSYIESAGMAFVFAFFSPGTFVAFFTVFGSLKLMFHPNAPLMNLTILSGTVLGGFLWWLLLTSLVFHFRDKIIKKLGNAQNKIFGGVMFLMTFIFATLFFV